ncbi:MAG TPA: cupin domain-containing protein, partial [Blastocatellia bacterium]|nr:cupin domain-containing protein [Blastocatellia bacterium]
FKGVQVAVVSEDRDTGARAMFVRLPPNKGAAAQAEDYHYHTVAAHTLVLEGTVNSAVNGRRITGKAGDYFRAPANWVHADSGSEVGATMFMITEGSRRGVAAKFGTVVVED